MDDKKNCRSRRRKLRRHGQGEINILALLLNTPFSIYQHEKDAGFVLINVRRAMKKGASLSY